MPSNLYFGIMISRLRCMFSDCTGRVTLWLSFCFPNLIISLQKGQKKNSRLERPHGDTTKSFRSCFLPSAQSPFLWWLRWRTGIENVPTRHLPGDTLFSCSLLILYPDLYGNATFSGLPKRDACIPPRVSLSCSSVLFRSSAAIFLISSSYLI